MRFLALQLCVIAAVVPASGGILAGWKDGQKRAFFYLDHIILMQVS